jgi:hypothetical protein
MAGDHRLGAGVEMTSAGIIAEPRPQLEHVIDIGRRQRADRRKPGQELGVIGRHRRDRGLLEHDFGQPDPVRVGRLPRQGAPRQPAAVAVIPGEHAHRVGTLRPGRAAVIFPLRGGLVLFPAGTAC